MGISFAIVQTKMNVYFKTKNCNIFELDALAEETMKDDASKIHNNGGIIPTPLGLSESTEVQHDSDTSQSFC